jgi:hypothetical protein
VWRERIESEGQRHASAPAGCTHALPQLLPSTRLKIRLHRVIL